MNRQQLVFVNVASNAGSEQKLVLTKARCPKTREVGFLKKCANNKK